MKISNLTSKRYVYAKGKAPKQPREVDFLNLCRKDFKDFKENNGDNLIEFLSKLVKEQEVRGKKTEIFKQHKDSLENVKKMIKEGNPKEAFLTFHRTFPYCMPYRRF